MRKCGPTVVPLEAEVLADAPGLRERVRDERERHGQVDLLAPVEAEEPHPGRDQPVGDALGGDDELVVPRDRKALRVERGRREGQAGAVEERGHVGDDDVARVERPVGDVEIEGVVAGRVEDALVVRDHVVAVTVCVVGDRGEAADVGAFELQARRQDLLAQEVKVGAAVAAAGVRSSARTASVART